MTTVAVAEVPAAIVSPEEESKMADYEEDITPYDPTARSCAWCYAVLKKNHQRCSSSVVVNCPTCTSRLFCSDACRQSDYPTHHFWCGKAGEKGVDFDIQEVDGKGLGMIAKRTFQRGEKILAERPVLTTTNVMTAVQQEQEEAAVKPNSDSVNENIRTAAMSLTPLQGSLNDKIDANGVSLAGKPNTAEGGAEGTVAAGLFLTFSRVNHDCLGNADHYFDHQHGVELLVANDIIPAHTEITFPYTRSGASRQAQLGWRGFTCDCKACHCQSYNDKVNAMVDLDHQVVELGRQPSDEDRQEAVQIALQLLKIYDDVQASCRDYARIHYDLFQILVVQQHTVEQAKQHMAKAHQYALSFCGYEQHETVQRYKSYVEHPEWHTNYRAID